MMNEIVKFLTESQTFFLATADGDQPRVRPFGAVMEWDGKLYICTNNRKKVFKEIMKNPKVEISSVLAGRWIRLCGKVAVDSRIEARMAMLDATPSIRNMYRADDGIFEVLYFTEGTAVISSFTEPPVEIRL